MKRTAVVQYAIMLTSHNTPSALHYPGQFFAPPQAVGNTTATCHDLIKQCNFERIPAGFVFPVVAP